MAEISREFTRGIKTEFALRPPKLYAVVIHNDDYTTMEFVVRVLTQIFHKSAEEAAALMLQVHEQGKGVCGLYTYDIAVTKAERAEMEALKEEFPLRLSVVPEEN